jgi:hypothetical protein
MDNLFIDLGSNCGQSLLLYSRLYPEKAIASSAFAVEASRSPSIQNALKEQALALATKYKSINIFNIAVSTDSRPITFYDGLGEGSSAIPYKFRYTLVRSWKGCMAFLVSSLANSRAIYSAESALSFIPLGLNSISVDLKMDIEGSEYQVVDDLFSRLPAKYFSNIFIEIHGAKAGKSLHDDFRVLRQSRILASCVMNWEAASDPSTENIYPLYYMDLCKLRLSHLHKSSYVNMLKRGLPLVDKILSKILMVFGCKILPLTSSLLYQYASKEFSHFPVISPAISLTSACKLSDLCVDMSSMPARDAWEQVRSDSSQLFSSSRGAVTYKSAILGRPDLLEHGSAERIKHEIYRFVNNPLLACPSILNLLTASCFKELSSAFPLYKLAGVNLRRCFGGGLEGHTSGFHRDYNSFATFKLFIPLLESSPPFLEYVANSDLDIRMPHYSPNHASYSELRPHYQDQVKYLGASLNELHFINTSCLHRESPLFVGDVLILTFLPHPDYGSNLLKARRADIQKLQLEEWAELLLSFTSLT